MEALLSTPRLSPHDGASAKHFNTFSAYIRKVESGNFQMTGSGWMADYPDAENFFQLLYGPNRVPGPNNASFDHPEYNALYEKSRYMRNGPERYAIFKRMSEILREEVPVILQFNGLAFGLYPPRLENMKRNMMWPAPYKFFDKAQPPVAAAGDV